MEQRKLYPLERRKLPPNRERDLMFFLLGAWVVQILEKVLPFSADNFRAVTL
jgi:hypothetical protein